MSRFVVGIDDVSEEQKAALRNKFSEWGTWWNWIPNFWLVVTDKRRKSSEIRDVINDIVPGSNCMVILVGQEARWSGYGPSTAKRDMFKWIEKKWGTVDDE